MVLCHMHFPLPAVLALLPVCVGICPHSDWQSVGAPIQALSLLSTVACVLLLVAIVAQ